MRTLPERRGRNGEREGGVFSPSFPQRQVMARD